ncbi:PREDICTED: C-type lectin domain family 17, member A-like [Nanorana parkeri]|uniref:C-type lectin domain family 17, member A-like n=1 Tax=Nanorana parkeri TaxID=125878 RepID=UPI00085402B1|nr:PREDICTED: C-type lectin domain family 17, member A-like [Nanorana parkeri]
MQDFYSKSVGRMKKARSIVDDDEDDYENLSDISKTPAVPTQGKNIGATGKKTDLQLKPCSMVDDDDDDYENVSDLTRTPAVPTREKKIDTSAKKEDLQLKWLDFSSPAVNSAFKDLPDEPSSKSYHGLVWKKLVLVMCLILLFLMVILIIGIMFTYLSAIQETAGTDRNNRAEDLRRVNQTFGKEINGLKSEILTLKREMGLCTSCPAGWTRVGPTCYYLSTSHKTWDESRKECVKSGSSLLILPKKEKLEPLLTITGNKRFWIGLRKLNGLWKWVDNTNPEFTSWNSGEPNNYDRREHCTEMIAGGWNDLDCSNTIDYIWSQQDVRGPRRLCWFSGECVGSEEDVQGLSRMCGVRGGCAGSQENVWDLRRMCRVSAGCAGSEEAVLVLRRMCGI